MRQAPSYIADMIKRRVSRELSLRWEQSRWQVHHGDRCVGVLVRADDRPLLNLDGCGEYIVAQIQSWSMERIANIRRGFANMALNKRHAKQAYNEKTAATTAAHTRDVVKVFKQGGSSPFLAPMSQATSTENNNGQPAI
jgi:hypothetical protein